jgi:hypothetical protein
MIPPRDGVQSKEKWYQYLMGGKSKCEKEKQADDRLSLTATDGTIGPILPESGVA